MNVMERVQINNVNKIINLSVVLIFLCFIGCKKNIETSTIDKGISTNVKIKHLPSVNDTLINIERYVDSIKYVELESVSGSEITSISDIFIDKDYIIVTTQKPSEVQFFHKDGKYSHKINRKGRGPGEYIDIDHTMIDTISKQILIFDHHNKRMNYYDYHGVFLRSINEFSQSAVIRDIINKPNGNFVCYNYDYYDDKYISGLWEVDSNGNIIKYYKEIQSQYPTISSGFAYYLYYTSEGYIGFFDQTFAEIGCINEDLQILQSFELSYKTGIDFRGQRLLSKEDLDQFYTVVNHMEKGRCRITHWNGNNNNIVILMDKNTGLAQVGMGINWIINKEIMPIGTFVPNNTNSILTSVISSSLVQAVLEDERDILAGVKELLGKGRDENQIIDMNPIIQFMYMKN